MYKTIFLVLISTSSRLAVNSKSHIFSMIFSKPIISKLSFSEFQTLKTSYATFLWEMLYGSYVCKVLQSQPQFFADIFGRGWAQIKFWNLRYNYHKLSTKFQDTIIPNERGWRNDSIVSAFISIHINHDFR